MTTREDMAHEIWAMCQGPQSIEEATEVIAALLQEFYQDAQRQTIQSIKKQILEEICFKMASGSPNRRRIHELMGTWE